MVEEAPTDISTQAAGSKLARAIELVARDGVDPRVLAKAVLESAVAAETELVQLRAEVAVHRAHSSLLIATTRKQQQEKLSCEELQLRATHQMLVEGLRSNITELAEQVLPASDVKPDPLQLVYVHATTIAADQQFDHHCYIAVRAALLLAKHRRIPAAAYAALMAKMIETESVVGADTAEELKKNSAHFAAEAMADIAEQNASLAKFERHETVVASKMTLQTRECDLGRALALEDTPIHGDASTVTFVLDVMTTPGCAQVCLVQNSSQLWTRPALDRVNTKTVVDSLAAGVTKALSSRQGMVVHILALGCNTIGIIGKLHAAVKAKDANAVQRVHVCATVDELPSAYLPVLLWAYGETGWQGMGGSLLPHEQCSRELLTEWESIYEMGSMWERSRDGNTIDLSKRLRWGVLSEFAGP